MPSDHFGPPAKLSALPTLRVPAARVIGNNKPHSGESWPVRSK